MCEISGVTELSNSILISCTPYDGSFMDSKTLRIYNSENDVYSTENFLLDRTRPCFNDNSSAPWIMLDIAIPGRFLVRGNKVELV